MTDFDWSKPTTRDLQAEKEAFEERVAICMFDGGLTETEAHDIAYRDLTQFIRRHDEAERRKTALNLPNPG